MKRTSKATFFIVAVLIFALAYTAFFGVYTTYGDRVDTVFRGAGDIRFGIDIRGGIDATFGPADDSVTVTQSNLDGVKDVIARRLIANGITDYEAYTDLNNKQVIVRFPWKADETEYDSSAALKELGKTALLEFRYGGSKTNEDGDAVPEGEVILTGADVASAEGTFSQDENGNNQYVVALKLAASGKDAFAVATEKQHKNGGTISIWLDGEMISNATVKDGAITTGEATISGGFADLAEAVALANLINSGSLPFSIEVKSSGAISATLGNQALDVMVWAAIIAFALVSLFMLLYYRLPGAVAVIALLGQVAGSLAVVSGYFSFFDGFTLTLPGIAGIIVSIGMGLDANIITAERIKEEIRGGRTIDGALRKGSEESFWAIFDGNVTVIIVAVILMGVFGPPSGVWAKVLTPFLFMFPAATTGSVYSFGFTLLAGIVFNFVMGVFASRAMLKSLCRFRLFRKPWLLGGDR